MMSDQPLTIQSIHWREAFPFTHLFRAFRVAIHPSKLLLGLIALTLLYISGTLLDYVCPIHYRAVPDEVTAYETFAHTARPGDRFVDTRDALRRSVEAGYAAQLLRYHVAADPTTAALAAQNGSDLPQLKTALLEHRNAAVADALTARNLDLAAARALPDGPVRAAAENTTRARYDQTVRRIFDDAAVEYHQARRIRGDGLFLTFFGYELNQISNVVTAVREGNFFGEAAPQPGLTVPHLPVENPLDPTLPATPTLTADTDSPAPAPGFFQAIAYFFTVGPVWLLTQHPVFFFLTGADFLVLWAIFGGAISRIAAVHVARDEKLSIRAALVFSVSKFFSFLCAPLIPLLIVGVLGVLVALGGAVGNIPWFGTLLVGAFFFLILIAGFVMTLVLFGLVGGFNLMYPTIAVEGSDSFDAISRSFSYLYARPWRLGFYTLVALIYGALTYLFIRQFIFVMLVLVHKCVGAAVFVHADSTAPLWTSLWPSPLTTGRLTYQVDFLSLNAGQAVGAIILSIWVYLVIALLGAFAVSFYFSANTIIYLLMRREVDATELDDVYLEEIEDPDDVDPAITPPPVPAPAATPAPVAASIFPSADAPAVPTPAPLDIPPPPT